jgi:hypothetical protein
METSMSQWVITDDLNRDPACDVSQVGARSVDCPAVWSEVADHPEGVKFRMRDELGQIIYQGVYLGDLRDEDILREPLVLVGAPFAQCVQIAYETQPNRWEVM